ncbi:MAG: phage terminase large subunit, partial [Candidatus Bathyarchaeia archaeon]
MSFKEIVLTEKQHRFVYAQQPICIFIGGWRAGKTYAGCVKAINYILNNPGCVILIGRRTYRELYDTTRATFFQILPPDWLRQYIASEDKALIQPSPDADVSFVLFRALDDWSKFGSLELAACFIDEATEFKDDGIFNFLLGRLSQRGYKRQIWLVANPAAPTHWLYERFVKRAGSQDIYEDDEIFYCRVRTVENPFIDQDYVRMQIQEMPLKWRQRFLEGDWVDVGGEEPIFSEYGDEHRKRGLDVILGIPLLRGWDIGHVHPACVIAQWLPVKRQLRVIWAEVQSNMWMGDFIEYVQGVTETLIAQAKSKALRELQERGASTVDIFYLSSTETSVLDFAGHDLKARSAASEKTVYDIFRERGIAPTGVWMPKIERIKLIHDLLSRRTADGEPMLVVDVEKASIVNDGFSGGYVWRKTADGK